MSNYYETDNEQNYQNDISQDQEYDEKIKNNFEMSIGSLGDIYNRPNSAYINNVRGGGITINHISSRVLDAKNNKSHNKDNTLEILKLKPSKLNDSNRFNHVKMGVTNPPKNTNSIKPIYEKLKDTHQKQVSKIVLFASKVDIPKTNYSKTRSKSRHRETKQNQFNSHNNRTEEIVIGSPVYKSSNTIKDNSLMMYSNSNRKNVKRPMSLIQKRQAANSKVTRELVKQVENLYSNTKNYLSAVNSNLPAQVSFKDLVKEGEAIEESINNFKINQNSVTKKIIQEESKTKRKSTSPKPKKPLNQNFQIDREDQKKLEEKLEILHLNTRQIFDSLSRLEENDPKVEVLKQKSSELNNLLKNYYQKFNLNRTQEHENQDFHMGNYDNMDEVIELVNQQTIHDQSYNNIQGGNSNVGFNQTSGQFSQKNDDVRSSSQTNFNMNSSNIVNIGQSGNIQLHHILSSTQKCNEENKDNTNYFKSSTSSKMNENMRLSGTNLMNSGNNFNKTKQSQGRILSSTNNQFNNTNYNNNQDNNSSNLYNPNCEPESNSLNNTLVQSKSNNFANNEESIVNYNKSISKTPYQLDESAQSILRKSANLNKLNERNSIKMTLATERQPEPLIKNNELKQDDRYTAYNIELPIDYYVNFVKSNEPPKTKEWFVRPHHIETVTKNEKGIADDVMNTKYISYYSPPDLQHPVTREEQINEVISKLESNIDNLKKDFYVRMNKDKNGRKKYEELEKMQEEIKKTYKMGQVYEELYKGKKVSTEQLLGKNSNFSEFFDKNDTVYQSNLVIKTYETLLDQLRDKEKDIILKKRKEEYEKIRPPQEKWWEEKSHNFQEELKRNRMVLNANPDYYNKLSELKDENLY